jgi:hypothetical protein
LALEACFWRVKGTIVGTAGAERITLLDRNEAIESVQDLLDHKHITTTQIYDKRRRSVRDSPSHNVPI